MTYRVVGIWHCVEGAYCHRELVQDEEVSAVLKVKVDISHQHPYILIYLLKYLYRVKRNSVKILFFNAVLLVQFKN